MIIIGKDPKITVAVFTDRKDPVVGKIGIIARKHHVVDETASVVTAQAIPGT